MKDFRLVEGVMQQHSYGMDSKLDNCKGSLDVMYGLLNSQLSILNSVKGVSPVQHNWGEIKTQKEELYRETKEAIIEFSRIYGKLEDNVDINLKKECETLVSNYEEFDYSDITVDCKIATPELNGYVPLENPDSSYKYPPINMKDMLTVGEIGGLMNTKYEEYLKGVEAQGGQDQYGNFYEYVKSMASQGQIEYVEDWRNNLNLFVDVVPILTEVNSFIEFIAGVELATGRKLEDGERLLSFATLLPLIPAWGDDALKLACKTPEGLVKVFGKELAENVGAAVFFEGANKLNIDPRVSMGLYFLTVVGGKGTISAVNFKNSINADGIKLISKEGFEVISNTIKTKFVKFGGIKNDSVLEVINDGDYYNIKYINEVGGTAYKRIEKTKFTKYENFCINGHCFIEGTLVHTINGLENIEKFIDGTEVLCYNEELKRKEYRTANKIVATATEFVKIFFDDDYITATTNHPFYTGKGWIEANKLKIGDKLYTNSSKLIIVKRIENFNSKAKNVYNLHVEELNNYYVGNEGILVHNQCDLNRLEDVYRQELEMINDAKLKEEMTKAFREIADKQDETLASFFTRSFEDVDYGDAAAIREFLDQYNTKYIREFPPYVPDPTLLPGITDPNFVWNGTKVVGGKTIVTNVGAFGEHIAEDFLVCNGWHDFVYIKNAADNGIDIIAIGPKGQLGFFEVKTNGSSKVPDLKVRQQDRDFFIRDVLYKQSNKLDNYKNISDIDAKKAGDLLKKFDEEFENVTGSVIGIDLINNNIAIQKWGERNITLIR